MPAADISLLLKALRQGDPRLLGVLFEQYGRPCVWALRQRTGCPDEEARDILMDALLVVRRNLLAGKVNTLDDPPRYLYTICYNLYRDRKQRKERQQWQQSEVTDRWYETVHELPLSEQSTDSDYRAHLLRTARAALAQLGRECQRVITYFYLDQLPMEEIAREMGWSSAQVAKNNKYRCMKKLIEHARELEKQEKIDTRPL